MITYVQNAAPVASIDSVYPDRPVEGKDIYLNGSGSDEDGSVSTFKWWTDRGPLASGPDKAHIKVTLPEGQHEIFLAVKDDDPQVPRWSEPVKKKIFVESVFDQDVPVVSSVNSWIG